MDKRVVILTLVPVSLALTLIAGLNQGFAEFYALNIYPVLAGAISFFSSKVKFSIGEFLIICLMAALIIYFVYTLVHTLAEKSPQYFKGFFLNIASFLSIVYFMYVLFCGINYHRHEFTYYSGLEIRESSEEELINLCEILINNANNARSGLGTGSEGTAMIYGENYYDTSERAKNVFNKISGEYTVLKGNYPSPKLVTFSKAMSYMNITGIFFPFTFEANVNADIPPYQVPAVMLHELAHLRGFMREDEANFISYLACINSGYDDFAYSGTMLALSHAMNSLYYEDYDTYLNLYDRYSDEVRNDLKYSLNYWKHYETRVAEVSDRINDSYLKANNQNDGVKSYGRMVNLLLAFYSGQQAD